MILYYIYIYISFGRSSDLKSVIYRWIEVKRKGKERKTGVVFFFWLWKKMEYIDNLPPMDLMRSETMTFVQLIIPVESAHRAISYLGQLGLLQFCDVQISLPSICLYAYSYLHCQCQISIYLCVCIYILGGNM